MAFDRLLAALRALLAPRPLHETIVLQRARAEIEHRRPTRWLPDGSPDPSSYELVGEPEVVWNVITNAGRDFLHTQGYGTAPAANGLNWIGLSNDALTETSASTTLSNEIAANGLARAQGVVAHTAGQNTTTVTKTFTCTTAPQSAQKAALFTAASNGVMNHALSFTQRNLQVGDTLTIQFTLTLG
jgi:hypothetical protein